jgi:hypothetical protein
MATSLVYPQLPTRRYRTVNPDFSTSNPEDMARQDRQIGYNYSDILGGDYAEDELYWQAVANGYRGTADQFFSDLMANPGYSPEEMAQITNQDDLRRGMTSDSEFQGNYMTDDEWMAAQGNPWARNQAYNPGQMEARTNEAQGWRRGALESGAENVRGALTGGEEAVRGAVAEGNRGVRGAVETGEQNVRGGIGQGEESVRGAISQGEGAVRGAIGQGTGAIRGSIAQGEQQLQQALDRGEGAVRGRLDQARTDVLQGQGELRDKLNANVGDVKGRIDTALANPELEITGNELRLMEDQAGRVIGNYGQSRLNEVETAAKRSGVVNPLAMAELKGRIARETAGSMADATADAKLRSLTTKRNVAAENTDRKIGAADTIGGYGERAATTIGQSGIQSGLALGEMGTGAETSMLTNRTGATTDMNKLRTGAEQGIMNTSVGAETSMLGNRTDAERAMLDNRTRTEEALARNRLSAEDAIAGRTLGAEDTLAGRRYAGETGIMNAGIGVEDANANDQISTARWNQETGINVGRDIDDTQVNRANYSTENRQGVALANQGARFNQGAVAQDYTRQGGVIAGNARRQDQQQGRDYFANQSQFAANQSGQAGSRRIEGIGVGLNAGARGTQNFQNYRTQNPSLGRRLTDAAISAGTRIASGRLGG